MRRCLLHRIAFRRVGAIRENLFLISTCSNHIERLHRTMNEITSPNQSIIQRISNVIGELRKYHTNFEDNSCKQSKYLYNKFKENAIRKNYDNCSICPYNCGWNEIYSNRFGIANYPCKHTVLSREIVFEKLKLNKATQKYDIPIILLSEQYQNWKFNNIEKTKNKTGLLTIKESVKLRYDQSDRSFIFQTVSEIYQLLNMKIAKNNILYDITVNWTILTFNLDESSKNNLEFRSMFRNKMIQKYQTIQ